MLTKCYDELLRQEGTLEKVQHQLLKTKRLSKINVPRPERRRQAAKTILLSLEIASTWRQRSAPQVITFIGTLVMMEIERKGLILWKTKC